MIVIASIVFVAVIAATIFIARPFMSKASSDNDAELESYFAQIDAIKANADLEPDEAAAAISAMERKISEKQAGHSGRSSAVLPVALFLTVLAISAGVYLTQDRVQTGRVVSDDATSSTAQSVLLPEETPAVDRTAQLEVLVKQLEDRLINSQDSNPRDWLIYARSLMSLERFDEALASYDQALERMERNDAVLEEYSRAKNFVARRQAGEESLAAQSDRASQDVDGRDAQEIEDAERQAMALAMLDGFVAKLEENPTDAYSWMRLINARQILEQPDQADADVARMRMVFADEPETAEQILQSIGWVD